MAETQSFLDNIGLKTFKNLNDEAYMANLTKLTDPYGFNMIEIAATFSGDLIANKTYTATLNNANEIFNLLQQSNINYQSIKLILTFNNNQINIPALFISNQNFSEWNASAILKNNNEFLYLNFIINYSTVSSITIVVTQQNSQNSSGNGLYYFRARLSLTPESDGSFPNQTKYEVQRLPAGVNWSSPENSKAEIVAIKFLNQSIEYQGNLYILEINSFKDGSRSSYYFKTTSFIGLYKINVTSGDPLQFTMEQIPAIIDINIQTNSANKMYYNITANDQNAVPVLCSGAPEMTILYTVPQEA